MRAIIVLSVIVLPVMPSDLLAQRVRGVVAGVVTDTAGQPIAYARIVVVGTDRDTTAAQHGHYMLPNVPVGVHKLRALFLGYRPSERDSIRVSANDTTWINFRLRRGENCDLDCNPIILPAPPKKPRYEQPGT